MTRAVTREQWKRYYRIIRVCRRESLKAGLDMMIYGTGVVRFTDDGDPQHVPFERFIAAENQSQDFKNHLTESKLLDGQYLKVGITGEWIQ